jgi:hypothetical protein
MITLPKDASATVSTNWYNGLLLARQMIAKGTIAFVLTRKKWRVNDGFDMCRKPPTSLAVPYRSKDQPVPGTEFSHPDISMILTCVGYYHQGLSKEQLRMALEHLLASNDPASEYSAWVEGAPDLPSALRDLRAVTSSIRDQQQWEEKVFPHLSSSRPAIFYFLSCIVFPKEMREYATNLTISANNLVERKAHPTSGCSGTIDGNIFLPLDISSHSLESEKHTNVEVLETILDSKNGVALVPQTPSRHASA